MCRAAGLADPGEGQRAWHRHSCRRRTKLVHAVGQEGASYTGPGEGEKCIGLGEAVSCTGPEMGAGNLHTVLEVEEVSCIVPEEGEADSHRTVLAEAEAKSTGSGEAGAEACPIECGPSPARRRRNDHSAGQIAESSPEGAVRRSEVEGVPKIGEADRRGCDHRAGHMGWDWADHRTAGVEVGTAAAVETASKSPGEHRTVAAEERSHRHHASCLVKRQRHIVVALGGSLTTITGFHILSRGLTRLGFLLLVVIAEHLIELALDFLEKRHFDLSSNVGPCTERLEGSKKDRLEYWKGLDHKK